MVSSSTTQQVFRQRTPLMLAAVCAVVGLALLVSLILDWAARPQPLFASWVLFGLALMWSLFVRPAVLLDVEGVTVRNIIRDIRIPWGEVTEVESRWNVKVLAGDRGYTAWAISSQVQRPRGASRGPLGSSLPGAKPSTPGQKVTASMVARSIEEAKEQYDEAIAQGALRAVPDVPVRITWAPLSLAILLLPAIAVVVLSLV